MLFFLAYLGPPGFSLPSLLLLHLKSSASPAQQARRLPPLIHRVASFPVYSVPPFAPLQIPDFSLSCFTTMQPGRLDFLPENSFRHPPSFPPFHLSVFTKFIPHRRSVAAVSPPFFPSPSRHLTNLLGGISPFFSLCHEKQQQFKGFISPLQWYCSRRLFSPMPQ